MCASAVSMVSIHPHSRCKLKRPGVPLYAVCCMLYAVSVRVSVPPSSMLCKASGHMQVSAICMVSNHPHSCLANDVLGSRCVLMLYACCLQGSRPFLESCKLSRRRSLWR